LDGVEATISETAGMEAEAPESRSGSL
jgi:hypothetical protein